MIHWRKLYSSPREGENTNSIIIYVKQPWVSKRETYHIKDTVTETRTRVIQHRYWLRIDLWLCQLDWQWESKIDE